MKKFCSLLIASCLISPGSSISKIFDCLPTFTPRVACLQLPGDALVVAVVEVEISLIIGFVGDAKEDAVEVEEAAIALVEDVAGVRELTFPPPEPLGSSRLPPPLPRTLQSAFLCSFEPHTKQRAFLSKMPSQLWLHLHLAPARQPWSLRNHLQGASKEGPPLPLPLVEVGSGGLFEVELVTVAFMGFSFKADCCSVFGVVIIKQRVSASAKRH